MNKSSTTSPQPLKRSTIVLMLCFEFFIRLRRILGGLSFPNLDLKKPSPRIIDGSVNCAVSKLASLVFEKFLQKFIGLIRMNKIILVIVLVIFGGSLNQAHAKSKTGLASSLIHEWESEVNREICPSFRYPSHPPSLVTGEKVFKQNCASCHNLSSSQKDAFRKETPEKQFEFVCGGNGKGVHAFAGKGKLDIDGMWDSLIYFRANVLGYYKENTQELSDLDATFGGNCAVCHGTRGQGDGNLHKALLPPPANFTMTERLYTRTDEKLFNELKYGIPWTAMPAWYNRYDFDKKIKFDEEMIWKLVRYVRQFSHAQSKDRMDIGREKLEAYKKSIGEVK
jgi:mono/diheme cytochrome c family protein